MYISHLQSFFLRCKLIQIGSAVKGTIINSFFVVGALQTASIRGYTHYNFIHSGLGRGLVPGLSGHTTGATCATLFYL